jgi:adenylosuccinate lyase
VNAAKDTREGRPNTLFDRLAADPACPVPLDSLRAVAEPARFIGRAPEQVDEFLQTIVQPLLDANPSEAPPAEVRV